MCTINSCAYPIPCYDNRISVSNFVYTAFLLGPNTLVYYDPDLYDKNCIAYIHNISFLFFSCDNANLKPLLHRL